MAYALELRRIALLAAWCGTFGMACGARSTLSSAQAEGDAGVQIICESTEDCDRSNLCAVERCVQGECIVQSEIDCDDADPCTEDTCDPTTGACENRRRTADLDGDGFFAPLAGHEPGEPGACGDDCDDMDATINPAAAELCDGRDNDCNGVIDDGARYLPQPGGPVRIGSELAQRSRVAGLAYNGQSYGVSYTEKQDRDHNLFAQLGESGSVIESQVVITDVNSDSFAGPLVFGAGVFATAWDDARQDGNYEVYFNRLDAAGRKFGEDVRVTDASSFSRRAEILFTGQEFLVVWEDKRGQGPLLMSPSRIYAQRIAADGGLLGQNVALSALDTYAENPSVALADGKVGLVYEVLRPGPVATEDTVEAHFLALGIELDSPTEPLLLAAEDVRRPIITAMPDRFAISWSQKPFHASLGSTYGPAILGATVSGDGRILEAPKPLTFGATFARDHAMVSLGDKLLLVWADDYDDSYNLYGKLLDGNLDELTPRQQLTDTAANTLSPVVSPGPAGDIGIVYDDWQTGARHAYFMLLRCTLEP